MPQSNEMQKKQSELHSKLVEAALEIKRGEKCVDAEKFLKDLKKDL